MFERIKNLFSKKEETFEENISQDLDFSEELPAKEEVTDNVIQHVNFQHNDNFRAPPAPPIVSTVEWDSLYRNAQDGGANSVLACHVLKKSMELLTNGNDQVSIMVNVAREVQQDTVELKSMAESINNISKVSKMISFNLAIEAARFSGNGATFNVVAEEMKKLADLIAEHSRSVEGKLKLVQERTQANEQMCRSVSVLFSNTNKELIQFKNLMLRIEELSTNQSEKLKNLEKKFSISEGSSNS